jgi:hypothetical protein
MRTTLYLGVLLILFCSGCTPEQYVAPTLPASPRTSVTLKNPILAEVSDDRSERGSRKAVSSLKAELTQIYGDNLHWVSDLEAVPKGTVSLQIRIVEMGSSLGSRRISSATYASAVKSAQAAATGPWGPVVSSATESSTIYGGTFSGQGWWNGAAWIDMEIQDNRSSPPIRFTIPLAAEYRVSNKWLYLSGDKAARKAWERVSVQLTHAIDDVLRVLRDSEG